MIIQKVEIQENPTFTFWYHVNTYLKNNGNFNAIRMKDALEAALKQQKELLEKDNE